MDIHPYHKLLLRCHVRQKIKGNFRLKLTCADRESLIDCEKIVMSKDHIVKVLNEKKVEPLNLSQYVLDQLASCVDYEDWNAFLRANPRPTELYGKMHKSTREKRTEELVMQRMEKLTNPES